MGIDKYRIPVLEAFPWQEPVKSRTVSSPPSPASKGDRYLVPPITPAGSLWRGKENTVAWYDGFEWHFDAPLPGWVLYVENEDVHIRWTGVDWISNLSGPTDVTPDNVLRDIYVSLDAEQSGSGSEGNPFTSITEAIQSVISKGDNNARAYIIHISPGEYSEDIILENHLLYNIYFQGSGSDLTIVHGLQSAQNNDQLSYMHFNGIKFTRSIYCEGENSGTLFAQNAVFNDCIFGEVADIVLYNMSNVTFTGKTEIHDNFRIANVSNITIDRDVLIFGQLAEQSMAIRCDLEQKLPADWPGVTKFYISSVLARFIDWQLHHGGMGYVQAKMGAILGVKNEPFHIPANTTYDVINSMLMGDYTYHGHLTLNNSFVGGTLTKGTGNLDIRNQPASQIYNDTDVNGDSVADVLNNFAERIDDLEKVTGMDDNILFDSTLQDMLIKPKYTII